MQESKFCVTETDHIYIYICIYNHAHNWKLEDSIGNTTVNHKTIKEELAIISKVVQYLHRTNILQKITNTMRSYI